MLAGPTTKVSSAPLEITMEITIEALESLALELCRETESTHAKLVRLCNVYARILAQREPERFRRGACHYGDQAGSWDSSFPPNMEYSDRTGPQILKLIAVE